MSDSSTATKILVKDRTYDDGEIPVYKGGTLHLVCTTRSGKFNILSNEESLSCHIAVYENGKQLVGCSVEPDYEYNGNDPEEAIYLIESESNRLWIDTARNKKRRCMNFIKRHKAEIQQGNSKNRLQQIDKLLTSLEKERQSILRSMEQDNE